MPPRVPNVPEPTAQERWDKYVRNSAETAPGIPRTHDESSGRSPCVLDAHVRRDMTCIGESWSSADISDFPAPCRELSLPMGPETIRSVDLSRNGCRIENTVQVVPGMNIALFLLPPGEDLPIVIHDAKVRWAGAAGIGIEFHTVADPYRAWLDLLINQLKRPH